MKNQQKKSKYVQKQKPPISYGFNFDPQLITFRTEIPQMPQKPRNKPEEKYHKKKVAELEQKKEALKQQRAQKKNKIKVGNSNFEQEQEDIKDKIKLGKKCLIVLNYDIQQINNENFELDQKIKKRIRNIRNLQKGNNQKTNTKKNYDQMTVQQLQPVIQNLQIRVTTQNLTKKQQTQINALIAKLKRLKNKAPQGSPIQNNDDEINNHEAVIQKLKTIKRHNDDQIMEIREQIEAIQDDLEDFQEQIQQIEEKKRNPETQGLKQQADEIKNKIRQVRQQILQLEKAFNQKKYQYQYEQTKIKWINFATQIKTDLQKQWQEEKAQRKRKRLLQKNKPESQIKQQDGKEGQNVNKRPKINKNQRQIDACNFLIEYCKGLYPKETNQKKQNTNSQKNIDIQKQLNKGEWKKQKGIQVIKSKKQNEDQQVNTRPKNKKKKEKKNQEAKQENKADNNFRHTVFVQNIFDSVKVLPPTTVEDLDKIIQDLTDKLQLFLEQPERASYYKFDKNDGNDKEKQKYAAQKYAKASKNQSKKLNVEDFPSLQ